MDERYPEPGEVLVGLVTGWAAHVLFPSWTRRWRLAGAVSFRHFARMVLLRTALNAAMLLLVAPAIRRWAENAQHRREALRAELGREPTEDELAAMWFEQYDQHAAQWVARRERLASRLRPQRRRGTSG